MSKELYLEPDQYEFDEEGNFRLTECFLYPWQVEVKFVEGKRVATMKSGFYKLKGCPENAPFQGLVIESKDY